MTANDAPQAEALTRLISESSAWAAADYSALINDSGGFGFVAELEVGSGETPALIIGFLIGRVAAGEAEILNLAVESSRRRLGAGSALLSHAIQALGGGEVGRLFLEVRESNAAARGLYRKMEFREVGRRRGYYRNPVEDALILERNIPGLGTQ